MKTWAVHGSLLLAICIATYLYERKFATPGKYEMVLNSLEGAKRILRKGAAIHFICNVPERGIMDNETFNLANSFSQYALAPVSFNQPQAAGNDTTLIISPIAMAGRVKDSASGTANVIWENQDSLFHYILISRKRYAP